MRAGRQDDATAALLAVEYDDIACSDACHLACAMTALQCRSGTDDSASNKAAAVAVITAKRAAAKLAIAGHVDAAANLLALVDCPADAVDVFVSRRRFVDAVVFALLMSDRPSLHDAARAAFASALVNQNRWHEAARVALASREPLVAVELLRRGALGGLVGAWVPAVLAAHLLSGRSALMPPEDLDEAPRIGDRYRQLWTVASSPAASEVTAGDPPLPTARSVLQRAVASISR